MIKEAVCRNFSYMYIVVLHTVESFVHINADKPEERYTYTDREGHKDIEIDIAFKRYLHEYVRNWAVVGLRLDAGTCKVINYWKYFLISDLHLHPEFRGITVDRLVYSPQDSICLSLEYYDK